MSVRRWIRDFQKDERGFTLPELLVTIAIMGILLAIAIIIWLGILEQRRVDAAANQFAADLRLSHSSATNQLTDWRVVFRVGSPKYNLIKLTEPCPESSCSNPKADRIISRSLPDGTSIVGSSNGADPTGVGRFKVYNSSGSSLLTTSINDPGATSTIEFNSDGRSYVANGPVAGLKVGSNSNASRCWKITVVAATSRVKLAKEDGCS